MRDCSNGINGQVSILIFYFLISNSDSPVKRSVENMYDVFSGDAEGSCVPG